MKKIFLAAPLLALALAGCYPQTQPPAYPAPEKKPDTAMEKKDESAMKKDDLDSAGADLNSAETEGLDTDVNAMEKDL